MGSARASTLFLLRNRLHTNSAIPIPIACIASKVKTGAATATRLLLAPRSSAGPACHRPNSLASGSPPCKAGTELPPAPWRAAAWRLRRSSPSSFSSSLSSPSPSSSPSSSSVCLPSFSPRLPSCVCSLIRFVSPGWYVAWRTVLVHVPLVQEIAGLRPKKPVKPKPANRGRFAKFYQNQAEAAQRSKLYLRTTTQASCFCSSGCLGADSCGN